MSEQKQFESFNTEIKNIFKLFKGIPSKGFKSQIHINELQSKMVQGMRTEEQYALTILGPLAWEAREKIASSDAKFFLDRRYEIDVAKLCKVHKINFDDAINTVNYMKEAYVVASKETQESIFKSLKTILSVYAQYLKAKREGELKQG